jgi:hypothetical protein
MDIVGDPVDLEGLEQLLRDAGCAIGDNGDSHNFLFYLVN